MLGRMGYEKQMFRSSRLPLWAAWMAASPAWGPYGSAAPCQAPVLARCHHAPGGSAAAIVGSGSSALIVSRTLRKMSCSLSALNKGCHIDVPHLLISACPVDKPLALACMPFGFLSLEDVRLNRCKASIVLSDTSGNVHEKPAYF